MKISENLQATPPLYVYRTSCVRYCTTDRSRKKRNLFLDIKGNIKVLVYCSIKCSDGTETEMFQFTGEWKLI